MFEVHHGDALDVARGMEPGSVHCIITSPPYWGLRDYGVDSAIGLEATPEEYVARLVEVFHELKRVLRDDGTLWLNMGDSYATHASKRSGQFGKDIREGFDDVYTRNKTPAAQYGLKELDLCTIPARVAMALQADGWCLRGTVIWNKPNPMPESQRGWRWEKHRIKVGNRGRNQAKQQGHFQDHSGNEVESDAIWADCPGCEKCLPHGGLVLVKGSGRPTTSHEYIFLLSKSKDYFFDSEAVREPSDPSKWGIRKNGTYTGESVKAYEVAGAQNPSAVKARIVESAAAHAGRNLRSVWTFPAGQAEWEYCNKCGTLYTGPNRSLIHKIPDSKIKDRLVRQCPKCKSTSDWVDHFAAFPLKLPELCIKAGTSEKGVCKKCGAPWVRVVEKVGESKYTEIGSPQGLNRSVMQWNDSHPTKNARWFNTNKTLDWLPSCNCDAGEPVPAVVIDPFCGSGQTGIAVLNLGRSFIGIDLKREYCDVAKARLKELASQQRLI